jgi:hypothetical protein
MKKFFKICSTAAIALAFSASVEAGDLTGKIDVVAPYLAGQNQLYLTLKNTTNSVVPDGSPGGTCSSSFAIALMSDANFKNFVYPLILLAKATDTSITLRTNGCYGTYPLIVGVDYTPR